MFWGTCAPDEKDSEWVVVRQGLMVDVADSLYGTSPQYVQTARPLCRLAQAKATGALADSQAWQSLEPVFPRDNWMLFTDLILPSHRS